MPHAMLLPGAAAIGTKIYVVGGIDSSLTVLGTNQVYDTASNKWSTATAMPTPRWDPSAAVVNGILYMIGGNSTISGSTAVVEAYDPTHDSWSEKAPLPISDAPVVAVDGSFIYAMGGYSSGSGRIANVYRYSPKTNTWTTRQPLKDGVSNPGVGTVGKLIVIADGLDNNGVTTETEIYAAQQNHWKVGKPDLTARTAGCSSAISGKLYLAGGELGAGSAPATNVLDVYDAQTNAWTAKATMPQAVVGPGNATVGGLLYCFGGASSGNPNGATFYNKVQVYQP